MSDTYVELVQQIRDDVGAVVRAVEALVGVTDTVLSDRVHDHAAMWASNLLGYDDKLAGQTVIDLMAVLWPDAGLPNEWWATPLGRAVARSVGHPTAEVVSYSVAGAMLGYSKQYVEKLIRAGKLDRGPDGGVTSLSVQMFARSVPRDTQ